MGSFIKNNKIYLLLIGFWSSLWISINTKVNEIYFLGESFIKNINALRLLIPIIISLSLFFLCFLKFIKKKKIKTNTILIFFILYFCSQIIGIYQNNVLKFDLNNLYLIILSLGSIEVFFLIEFYKLQTKLKYFLYVSIIIIFATALSLLGNELKNYNFSSLELYKLISPEKSFLNQPLPRITGLSRMMALLNIFLVIILFFKKNNDKKFMLLILISFISFIIWSMQSRGTIVCYFTCIILLIFIQKKVNILKKILYLFFLIIAPVILFQSINYKYYNSVNGEKNNLNNYYESSRFFLHKTNDSGRSYLWKESLQKYDKTKIFGYGQQGDRFLLEKSDKYGFGDNVSNAFIYAFLSGGYVALLIFILIIFHIIIIIYKNIFTFKIFANYTEIEVKLATIFLIFFLIRMLFENSFAMFGVDFLLMIICITISKSFLSRQLSFVKF